MPVPMDSIDATRRLTEITFGETQAAPLASNQALDRLRDAAWIVLAAETLGASQAMLDKAVAYAKERKQFGRVDRLVPGGEAPLRRDGRRAGAARRSSGTPPTPSTRACRRRR